MKHGAVIFVFVIFISGFLGCSQKGLKEGYAEPVILQGIVVYPDTTIIDNKIVRVKLNPGPDTLRVSTGQFTISVPEASEHQMIMAYEGRRSFPPMVLSLKPGMNRLNFMLPREEDFQINGSGRARDRVGEEARIVIIRP